MSFTQNINKILEELKQPKIPRQQFINTKIQERLDDMIKSYDDELDKALDFVNNHTLNYAIKVTRRIDKNANKS